MLGMQKETVIGPMDPEIGVRRQFEHKFMFASCLQAVCKLFASCLQLMRVRLQLNRAEVRVHLQIIRAEKYYVCKQIRICLQSATHSPAGNL
jgi:hypothetical protein